MSNYHTRGPTLSCYTRARPSITLVSVLPSPWCFSRRVFDCRYSPVGHYHASAFCCLIKVLTSLFHDIFLWYVVMFLDDLMQMLRTFQFYIVNKEADSTVNALPSKTQGPHLPVLGKSVRQLWHTIEPSVKTFQFRFLNEPSDERTSTILFCRNFYMLSKKPRGGVCIPAFIFV